MKIAICGIYGFRIWQMDPVKTAKRWSECSEFYSSGVGVQTIHYLQEGCFENLKFKTSNLERAKPSSFPLMGTFAMDYGLTARMVLHLLL